MHEKDITKILAGARGETDAPLHRARLRRAVLSMQPRHAGFAPLQGFITLIQMNKYYLSVGSVAAVVALALLVSVSPLSTRMVSAQEQVQRAYARAIEISPEMRAQIETQMKADMLKTLEEAKAAPDLKVMTREEYEKSGQFTFSTQPGPQNIAIQGTAVASGATNVKYENAGEISSGEAGSVTFTVGEATAIPAGEIHTAISQGTVVVSGEMKMATGTFIGATAANTSWSAPVKYLSYTDPEGHKTVLGLDENDTPVFKISTLNTSDIQDMGNGAIGIDGKQLQILKVDSQGAK